MTQKLILLAFLFGGVLLYALLTRRKGTIRYRTGLDSYIPFIPEFIFAYFGLFIFVPLGLIYVALTPLAIPFLLSLDIAMYSAAFFWWRFPAYTDHPVITRKGSAAALVGLLYKDDHANAFPSAHVFTSVISAYFLSFAFPVYAWFFILVGTLIAASTLLVKQHHAVDLISGILWAAASVALATHFAPFIHG